MPRAPQDDFLSTDFGVEALYEAAGERGISHLRVALARRWRDARHRLFAHEAEHNVATVLELARIRVRYRGPAQAHVAFVGESDAALAGIRSARRAIPRKRARAGAPRYRLSGRGEGQASREMRAARASRSSSRRDGCASRPIQGERRLGFRTSPATLAYSPGHLDVSARHPPHVALLATELGRAGFGDAGFFRPASLVSLPPLQRGPKAFRVPPAFASLIARIRMIECDWDSGARRGRVVLGGGLPERDEEARPPHRRGRAPLDDAPLRLHERPPPRRRHPPPPERDYAAASLRARASSSRVSRRRRSSRTKDPPAILVARALDPVRQGSARVLRRGVRRFRAREDSLSFDQPRGGSSRSPGGRAQAHRVPDPE